MTEREASGETPAVRDTPEVRRAQELCVRLLGVRARSRTELRQAMARKEIEEEVAELVLGRLDRAGLIDDEAFAHEWVASRHSHKGLSRRALVNELRRKGVDDSVAAQAAATVGEDSELERAREIVRRKLPSVARVDDTAKLRRLVGVLARKGYNEGMALRVVREELSRDGAAGLPDDDF
ncbi:regulatory protein RecX [Kutzneria sp. 744]|uniref:regulatory protein RecX n=1 Tax=Kutzneria sp. (strain 744) TaxID=345341 RepID=UPI0004B31876|nr:regulatory protein RecX [Kutzneria sp. 744]